MKPKIRKYKPSDRKDCRALWRELTEWHRCIYGDPSIGGDKPGDYFDEHLKNVGQDRIWVATAGDMIVGFAGLVVQGDEAELEPLIVSEGHRGQGIGKKLFEAVRKEAESLKVKYLNVRPVARNESAIRYFHERGFDKVGRIELFIDYSNKKWRDGLKVHGKKFRY